MGFINGDLASKSNLFKVHNVKTQNMIQIKNYHFFRLIHTCEWVRPSSELSFTFSRRSPFWGWTSLSVIWWTFKWTFRIGETILWVNNSRNNQRLELLLVFDNRLSRKVLYITGDGYNTLFLYSDTVSTVNSLKSNSINTNTQVKIHQCKYPNTNTQIHKQTSRLLFWEWWYSEFP